MDSIWRFELLVNLFLQGLGTWLLAPMKMLSFLGQGYFFILVMPAFYWCFDARLGIRISTMLLLTNSVNAFLKTTFRFPRPFWYDSRVLPFAAEKTFGLPSGHAQTSSGVFGLLAARAKRPLIRVVVWALVILIGVSRLYLGVHFTSDVIVGWLAGLVLLVLFMKWEKAAISWFNRRSFPARLGLCFLFSLLLLGLSILPALVRPAWSIPGDWLANASRVIPPGQFNPLDISNSFILAGLFFGMAAGFVALCHRHGVFQAGGPLKERLFRYSLGMLGLALVWYVWGQFFPETDDFPGYGLRFLRYTLVGIWITYAAPLLSNRLGLLVFENQPVER